MNDPQYQTWPDGTRVRFSREAREAMTPKPPKDFSFPKPLRTPQGGPDAVYTIDNTDDSMHDVILRENGERWGCFWLESVEPMPSRREEIPSEDLEAHMRSVYTKARTESDGPTIDSMHLAGLKAVYELATPRLTPEALAQALCDAMPHPGGGSQIVYEDALEASRAALKAVSE